MFPNDQTKLEDSTTPHSADTTLAGERLRPFLFQLVELVGPAYAARLRARGTLSFKDEESLHAGRLPTDSLQTSTATLPQKPDTQLGAFGPGADPTRSRAAISSPRLAVNFIIF